MYGPEHTFLAVEAAQGRVEEDSLEDIVVGRESANHAEVAAGTGDMAGKAAADAAAQEILYLGQGLHAAENTPQTASVASHASVVACAAEAGAAAAENIHAEQVG